MCILAELPEAIKKDICHHDEKCPRMGTPCADCLLPVCAVHSTVCPECRLRVCEGCEGTHPALCSESKGDYAGGPSDPVHDVRRV